MKQVPAGKLRGLLGVARIDHVQGHQPLAIIDTPLGAA